MIVPIYQLYLLQLENYELGRYWKLLFQKGFFSSKIPLRKSIVWTAKAITIFVFALILSIFLLFIGVYLFFSLPIGLILLPIGFVCFPFLYTFVCMLLWPFDAIVKHWYIQQAKKLLVRHIKARIIGISGSYGKTTMKNVLSSVLSAKFRTITTPESVNTPIGIAQWLLKTLKKETEVIIIEYGEHYQGDIAGLCHMFPPDIAVLTGINEAHLERLKTLDTSITTMFEIVEHAKTDAVILLNADDEHIRSSYKKFVKNKRVSFYSGMNDSLAVLTITKKVFIEEKLGWDCTFQKLEKMFIPLLGEYALGDVAASIVIGNLLGMNAVEFKKGIADIKPIPHRLEPIIGSGEVLVIDDSYNGNPDGVTEAIRVLSRFKKRRKIYITPGLVEIGPKAPIIHEHIGRELAGVVDRVILVKNSVTPSIEKGLLASGFDPSHIIWFNTALEAHEALSGIIQAHDVVLFQNDWGDQYI